MKEKKIIELKNINKAYAGVQALNDVNIVLKQGETHCLVGENGSGKSTLIKIISGVVQPDTGEIIINGKIYKNLRPIDSIYEGIQVIYQDLSLYPSLTVAENISINQYIEKRGGFINWKEIQENAKKELLKIKIDLDLDELVEDISIANRQLVAICRALTLGAKIIIMDEPTTALTKKEIMSLFGVINNLKKSGISTLFVSHKLNEIFEISERVTVLRDGNKVGEFLTKELDDEKLIFYMTGKKIDHQKFEYKKTKKDEVPVLEVKNLTHKRDFENISFKLYPGEILGIAGLLGSGRTELALSLFGLNRVRSGDVFISGKPIKINSSQDAVKNGIGYLPEDRLNQGLFLSQPISTNLIATIMCKILNRLRLFSENKKKDIAIKLRDRFNIKASLIDEQAQTLSGGNQQRIAIAKWIATNPKVFILDSPTVGIDIASKINIHNIVRDLASSGVGVILISDEIPEILQNCNRALIMREGKLIQKVEISNMDEKKMYNIINGNNLNRS